MTLDELLEIARDVADSPDPMTLDDLLALARAILVNGQQPPSAEKLARAILDLFPSDAGCGAAEPMVRYVGTQDGKVVVPPEWVGEYEVHEARQLMFLLARAVGLIDGGAK